MVTQEQVPGIIATVRDRLSTAAREQGIHLKVHEDEFRLEDDWLYLLVTPSQAGVRASHYADLMSQIEKELRKNGTDNVLLFPTLRD